MNKLADQNIRSIENYVLVTARVITDLDYINFLVAAQWDVSCVKLTECYSDNGIWLRMIGSVSDKTVTETFWNVVERCAEKRSGWLSLDDRESCPVSSLVIPDDGLTVHIKRYSPRFYLG